MTKAPSPSHNGRRPVRAAEVAKGASVDSEGCNVATSSTSTGALNRYPCRATVSIHSAASGAQANALRMADMLTLRLTSSTTTPGQTRRSNSSFVSKWPCWLTRTTRRSKALPASVIDWPSCSSRRSPG